jgi:hypothetical protein
MENDNSFSYDRYWYNADEITFDEFFDLIEIALYSTHVKRHRVFTAMEFNGIGCNLPFFVSKN